MYPYVEESIHDMQNRRINDCVRLPANPPLQPPLIEPLQFVPVDAEVVDDQTRSESANHKVSLSPSNLSTQTSEPSVLDNLVNHYSGELTGYESNLERASKLASEVSYVKKPPTITKLRNGLINLHIHCRSS